MFLKVIRDAFFFLGSAKISLVLSKNWILKVKPSETHFVGHSQPMLHLGGWGRGLKKYFKKHFSSKPFMKDHPHATVSLTYTQHRK